MSRRVDVGPGIQKSFHAGDVITKGRRRKRAFRIVGLGMWGGSRTQGVMQRADPRGVCGVGEAPALRAFSMPLTSPAEAAVMSASSAEMLATVGEEACATAASAAVGDPEGTGGAEEAAFSESAEAGGAALSNRARPLRSARRGMGQRGRLPGEKAEDLIAVGELCSVYLNKVKVSMAPPV